MASVSLSCVQLIFRDGLEFSFNFRLPLDIEYASLKNSEEIWYIEKIPSAFPHNSEWNTNLICERNMYIRANKHTSVKESTINRYIACGNEAAVPFIYVDFCSSLFISELEVRWLAKLDGWFTHTTHARMHMKGNMRDHRWIQLWVLLPLNAKPSNTSSEIVCRSRVIRWTVCTAPAQTRLMIGSPPQTSWRIK